MTKLLAAISLMTFSYATLAAGPIDGIYLCQGQAAGQALAVYIAINSNASTTVVTIPYVQGVTVDGYIVGAAATGTSLSGVSNYGYPWSATASGAVGAKTLSLTGTFVSAVYGPVPSTASCTQII